MKKHFTLSLVAVAMLGGLTGYWLGKPAQHSEITSPDTAESGRKVLYWYDPMTPGQRFNQPGKSPFMDMELVPRYADQQADDGGVIISARQQQNLGIRTEKSQMRSLNLRLTAYGTVATDERSVSVIPARANGIVEQLWVRANQQQVSKNQPLASLWIPEWNAAQQEYLAIRKLGDNPLTSAARQRLQLQFMPDEIIRQVEKSGQPQTLYTLRAPSAGYVNKLDIRAGAQVSATQSLFELASLDPVWVVIDYPQAQASQLQLGSAIQATSASWPGEIFHGKVSELLPNMDLTTRTLKARIVLDNPQQKLKPGMYLNLQATSREALPPVLAIPQEALLLTGSRSRVLVSEGDGHFKPVNVTAGHSQDGWVEIKQGLSLGEQVVTSGQFLIDSEASLQSVLPQMEEPKSIDGSNPTSAVTPDTYSASGRVNAIDGQTITLSHGAIPALKWGPMTMDFTLPESDFPANIHVGAQVDFQFTLDDNGAHIQHINPSKLADKQQIHGGHL